MITFQVIQELLTQLSCIGWFLCDFYDSPDNVKIQYSEYNWG